MYAKKQGGLLMTKTDDHNSLTSLNIIKGISVTRWKTWDGNVT